MGRNRQRKEMREEHCKLKDHMSRSAGVGNWGFERHKGQPGLRWWVQLFGKVETI